MILRVRPWGSRSTAPQFMRRLRKLAERHHWVQLTAWQQNLLKILWQQYEAREIECALLAEHEADVIELTRAAKRDET